MAENTTSSEPIGTDQQAKPVATERPKLSGGILVSSRQKGNPILKFVRNVPWEFTDSIVPDYVIGQNACALYLSLKYHTLNPNYIHERLKLLGNASYNLRILLVQVDVQEPHHVLKQLMRICILAELTLMLAWSPEEAGKILETYKMFESKPPDMIMEKSNPDPHSKMVDTLTTVKSVNKTDAVTLLTTFGSLEKIVKASVEDLTLCPGFGPQKAQRLNKVLNMPFKK